MAFVSSCIESEAENLNLGYKEIFERMDRIGMIIQIYAVSAMAFVSAIADIAYIEEMNKIRFWILRLRGFHSPLLQQALQALRRDL